MKQQIRILDLRDICGEGNLASVLGVGIDSVGGLWKKLKRLNENSRIQELDSLAAELERQLIGADSVAMLEELGRWYRISPKIVKPLIGYYRTKNGQNQQQEVDRCCYFFH